MACCYRCSLICVSVCLLVTPAKMAQPIELPFGLWTRVGPRNHALVRDPNPPGEGAVLGDVSRLIVKYRERICSAAAKRLTQSRCCFGCVLGCLEIEEDGCECRLRLNTFLFMSMCSWMWLYHVFSWPLSLVICFVGLVPLYWPRLDR